MRRFLRSLIAQGGFLSAARSPCIPSTSDALVSSWLGRSLNQVASDSVPASGALRSFASGGVASVAPPQGYVPVSISTIQPRMIRKAVQRLGRGPGGGSRFAGRGLKGMKARYSVHPLFEGGRVRYADRLPKVGFRNKGKLVLRPCALGRIVESVKSGDLDPTRLITMKALRDTGVVQRGVKDGVKVLMEGAALDVSEVSRLPPLHLEVTRCSAAVRQIIEEAGGSVTKVYYSRLCLYAMLEPERWWRVGKPLPRASRPKPRHAHKWEAVGQVPAPTEIPQARLAAAAARAAKPEGSGAGSGRGMAASSKGGPGGKVQVKSKSKA